MIRHVSLLVAPIVVGSFFLSACTEEHIDSALPSAQPSDTPPPDGTGGGGGSPPGPPPKHVRDVYVRNPLGTRTDNLMVDGDFELSIVPDEFVGGQYPWLAFTTTGTQVGVHAETGGICEDSLRCARVPGSTVLFGRGAAAPDSAPHDASVHLKLLDPSVENKTKPCALGRVYMVECDTFAIVDQLIPADAPDDRKWCELSSTVRGSTSSLCMYIEVGAQEVLVDSALLVPSPEGQGVAPHPKPIASLETGRSMIAVRDFIRKHTIFGRGPETAPSRRVTE